MKIGDSYLAEGYRIVAFRGCLSFGFNIKFEDNRLLKMAGKNENVQVCEFEGLIINLPFCELIFGTVFIPTKTLEFKPDA